MKEQEICRKGWSIHSYKHTVHNEHLMALRTGICNDFRVFGKWILTEVAVTSNLSFWYLSEFSVSPVNLLASD